MDETTVLQVLRDPRFFTVEQQRCAMAAGAELIERYQSEYAELRAAVLHRFEPPLI